MAHGANGFPLNSMDPNSFFKPIVSKVVVEDVVMQPLFPNYHLIAMQPQFYIFKDPIYLYILFYTYIFSYLLVILYQQILNLCYSVNENGTTMLYGKSSFIDYLTPSKSAVKTRVSMAFIINGSSILVARRGKDSKPEKLINQICVPGGKIEEEETPIDCMFREVAEEVGNINIVNATQFGIFAPEFEDIIAYLFVCTSVDAQDTYPVPSKEQDKIKGPWVFIELKDLLASSEVTPLVGYGCNILSNMQPFIKFEAKSALAVKCNSSLDLDANRKFIDRNISKLPSDYSVILINNKDNYCTAYAMNNSLPIYDQLNIKEIPQTSDGYSPAELLNYLKGKYSVDIWDGNRWLLDGTADILLMYTNTPNGGHYDSIVKNEIAAQFPNGRNASILNVHSKGKSTVLEEYDKYNYIGSSKTYEISTLNTHIGTAIFNNIDELNQKLLVEQPDPSITPDFKNLIGLFSNMNIDYNLVRTSVSLRACSIEYVLKTKNTLGSNVFKMIADYQTPTSLEDLNYRDVEYELLPNVIYDNLSTDVSKLERQSRFLRPTFNLPVAGGGAQPNNQDMEVATTNFINIVTTISDRNDRGWDHIYYRLWAGMLMAMMRYDSDVVNVGMYGNAGCGLFGALGNRHNNIWMKSSTASSVFNQRVLFIDRWKFAEIFGDYDLAAGVHDTRIKFEHEIAPFIIIPITSQSVYNRIPVNGGAAANNHSWHTVLANFNKPNCGFAPKLRNLNGNIPWIAQPAVNDDVHHPGFPDFIRGVPMIPPVYILSPKQPPMNSNAAVAGGSTFSWQEFENPISWRNAIIFLLMTIGHGAECLRAYQSLAEKFLTFRHPTITQFPIRIGDRLSNGLQVLTVIQNRLIIMLCCKPGPNELSAGAADGDRMWNGTVLMFENANYGHDISLADSVINVPNAIMNTTAQNILMGLAPGAANGLVQNVYFAAAKNNIFHEADAAWFSFFSGFMVCNRFNQQPPQIAFRPVIERINRMSNEEFSYLLNWLDESIGRQTFAARWLVPVAWQVGHPTGLNLLGPNPVDQTGTHINAAEQNYYGIYINKQGNLPLFNGYIKQGTYLPTGINAIRNSINNAKTDFTDSLSMEFARTLYNMDVHTINNNNQVNPSHNVPYENHRFITNLTTLCIAMRAAVDLATYNMNISANTIYPRINGPMTGSSRLDDLYAETDIASKRQHININEFTDNFIKAVGSNFAILGIPSITIDNILNRTYRFNFMHSPYYGSDTLNNRHILFSWRVLHPVFLQAFMPNTQNVGNILVPRNTRIFSATLSNANLPWSNWAIKSNNITESDVIAAHRLYMELAGVSYSVTLQIPIMRTNGQIDPEIVTIDNTYSLTAGTRRSDCTNILNYAQDPLTWICSDINYTIQIPFRVAAGQRLYTLQSVPYPYVHYNHTSLNAHFPPSIANSASPSVMMTHAPGLNNTMRSHNVLNLVYSTINVRATNPYVTNVLKTNSIIYFSRTDSSRRQEYSDVAPHLEHLNGGKVSGYSITDTIGRPFYFINQSYSHQAQILAAAPAGSPNYQNIANTLLNDNSSNYICFLGAHLQIMEHTSLAFMCNDRIGMCNGRSDRTAFTVELISRPMYLRKTLTENLEIVASNSINIVNQFSRPKQTQSMSTNLSEDISSSDIIVTPNIKTTKVETVIEENININKGLQAAQPRIETETKQIMKRISNKDIFKKISSKDIFRPKISSSIFKDFNDMYQFNQQTLLDIENEIIKHKGSSSQRAQLISKLPILHKITDIKKHYTDNIAAMLIKENLVLKGGEAAGVEQPTDEDIKRFRDLKQGMITKFKDFKNIVNKIDAIKAQAVTPDILDTLEKINNLDF